MFAALKLGQEFQSGNPQFDRNNMRFLYLFVYRAVLEFSICKIPSPFLQKPTNLHLSNSIDGLQENALVSFGNVQLLGKIFIQNYECIFF